MLTTYQLTKRKCHSSLPTHREIPERRLLKLGGFLDISLGWWENDMALTLPPADGDVEAYAKLQMTTPGSSRWVGTLE